MTITRRPRLGAQPLWSFPAATEHVLSNGLTVWAFDVPGQYVISVAMALDLPLTAEPADSEGIATVTSQALDEGTLNHPGADYTRVLENTGAVIGAGVSQTATHVSVDVPVTALADALPLFAEVVRTPALADDDVMRHVGLRRAEIRQVLANSAQLAGAITPAAVFAPSSRASRPTGGTTAGLESLDPDAVRAFHAGQYSPAGATLVVAGDFAGTDPVALVEDAFGDWERPATPRQYAAPNPTPARRRLVGRPGAVQADVRIAAPTIDRADPRWPAFQVATAIMGGTFQSRLNTELRERRGFTYGVHMTGSQFRRGGYSSVGGSFRTEVVADAVAVSLRLLDVEAKPFTRAEVTRAVNYLTRTAPLRAATAAGVAQQAVVLAAMGLSWRYVDETAARLVRITPDEATAAFAAIWPRDPAVVVVGDPGLAEPLGVEAEEPPAL